MYVKRYFSYQIMYFISWRMVLWSLFTGGLALGTYHFLEWRWVAIPWLPVSLIGTAVAFYVGFKNNQSYERGWEARKVWGAITNLSRSFIAAARSLISDDSAQGSVSHKEIRAQVCVLAYRHLAWLHALKHAMWQRTAWEHSQIASVRQRRFFGKHIDFSSFENDALPCLEKEELEWVKTKRNPATQLLDRQSQHLAELRRKGLLDDLRHLALQQFITDLYAEQGASERIKNTPLPRQYSTTSAILIILFTLLLPFGMLRAFENISPYWFWLIIPFNMIVSWVFSLMEYVGDYSENPFEGLMNDVPIQSIVRSIEIDIRDMLGEENLPERMKPVLDVLF